MDNCQYVTKRVETGPCEHRFRIDAPCHRVATHSIHGGREIDGTRIRQDHPYLGPVLERCGLKERDLVHHEDVLKARCEAKGFALRDILGPDGCHPFTPAEETP